MGFIIIEQVLIQKFMLVIGYPVYAFSVVICALLLSAGVGSFMSMRLDLNRRAASLAPFLGIVSYGLVLTLCFKSIAGGLMASPGLVRLVASFLLILPLGFALGVPFPIGIRMIARRGRVAVAWAWGMNGLATVIGSLVAAVLALSAGLTAALCFALTCYGLSSWLLIKMKQPEQAFSRRASEGQLLEEVVD